MGLLPNRRAQNQPGEPVEPPVPPSAQRASLTPPGGKLPPKTWEISAPDDLPAFSVEKPSSVYPMPEEEPLLKGPLRPVGAEPPPGPPPALALEAPRAPARPRDEAALEPLKRWLRQATDMGASDLHLSRGVPATVRMDGQLRPLEGPALTREAIERIVLALLNPLQRERFEKEWELDFSTEIVGAGRFRTNVHKQRGGIEVAFRVVNTSVLPLRRLGLPPVVEEITRRLAGMVLVTGPTGSGKSTTLAAMIDQINTERSAMIITVEDPIEYIHANRCCIIKQREVMSDTRGFGQALRHALRQDPDVIVIGEMRDLETIATSLTAAETGHLVFSTLHTPDATQTVDRIIDVFPPHQQEQARIQTANTLQAVVAQQLVPTPGNKGRVVAVEVLIANMAVRKIIRSGKTEQLYTTMQTSWDTGMITMDKSLKALHQQGVISYEDAISRARYPSEFAQL